MGGALKNFGLSRPVRDDSLDIGYCRRNEVSASLHIKGSIGPEQHALGPEELRAEKAFLREWNETRPRRRRADEIHRGKAQKFYTVLSDLVHGEMLGLAPDRTEASLTGLLTTCLDGRQRAAVEAVCTDMHQPYLNAVGPRGFLSA